jgi:hypothetical protein
MNASLYFIRVSTMVCSESSPIYMRIPMQRQRASVQANQTKKSPNLIGTAKRQRHKPQPSQSSYKEWPVVYGDMKEEQQ